MTNDSASGDDSLLSEVRSPLQNLLPQDLKLFAIVPHLFNHYFSQIHTNQPSSSIQHVMTFARF